MGLKVSVKDLTICSVVFNAKWQLDLNWDLVTKLNQEHGFTWIMILNKPIQPQIPVKTYLPPKYQVIEGIENNHPPKTAYRPSFHHAGGLNKAATYIRTRFALYLEPDFYVIRPNWIKEVLQHMVGHKLAVLCAPWHPRMYKKPRYFLAPFFFLVDTHKVNIQELDWNPISDKPQVYSLSDKLWKILLFLILADRRRKSICKDRDTGIRIQQKYFENKSIMYENLSPVFGPIDPKMGIIKRPFIEYFLPDRFCFIPKNKGYFTKKGFSSFGKPDLNSMGAEEYMWNGEPFAVHLRTRTQLFNGEEEIESEWSAQMLKSLV